MLTFLGSFAWLACLVASPAPDPSVGMTLSVYVKVRDVAGEPIQGVKVVARSRQGDEVLLTTRETTSADGVAEVTVLALHEYSIAADSVGFVPVVVGPTYPNLRQRLAVVMNRTEERQFVPLR